MTTIQQALHIFRKDARHLRFEVAATGLLLVILLFTGVQTWEGLQESGGRTPGPAGPLTVLLLISWCLLIARVIQTEALPGDRQFWLTRPYSRASLVLSKALFIITFINLPLLVTQAAIVSMDGLPLSASLGGLFGNQLLLSVLVLLPVAAIAALTRNLAQFLPAAVLVGAVLAVPLLERRGYGDLDWVPAVLGGAITIAIAGFILWRQYRVRRSVRTALWGAAATAVGIIVYAAFPQSAAFAVQSQLKGSPDGPFALSLGQPAPRDQDTVSVNRFRQLVAFPIVVEGANPVDLRIQSVELTFRTLSGVRRRTRAQVEVVEGHLRYVASLDRTFFDAARDSRVHLEAEVYLTQYGNARSTEVPQDGTPVYIAGPGQCGVVAGYSRRRFVCRSAFRSPQPFQSDQVVPFQGFDPLRDTRLVPRVAFLVYPVASRSYQFVDDDDHMAPASPLRPTSILVRDPVAYFRHTMEAPNVRLGDFAVDPAGGQ
jgi:hypothetical protein